MRRVVAVYQDVTQARRVISELERHGIEAADISLSGPGATDPASMEETRQADARAGGYLAWRLAAGSLAGALLGGLAGWLLTLNEGGRVVLTAVLVGVIAGSGVAAMLAAMWSLGMSPAWERSFQQPGGGQASVAVQSDDPDVIEQGMELMKSHHPVRIEGPH